MALCYNESINKQYDRKWVLPSLYMIDLQLLAKIILYCIIVIATNYYNTIIVSKYIVYACFC